MQLPYWLAEIAGPYGTSAMHILSYSSIGKGKNFQAVRLRIHCDDEHHVVRFHPGFPVRLFSSFAYNRRVFVPYGHRYTVLRTAVSAGSGS